MTLRQEKREQAARLVAARKPIGEIAALIGCSPRTINAWKADEKFRALVHAEKNAWRKRANSQGLADPDFTLRNLQDRHKRLRAIIDARAKDPEHRKAPGGKTGLLTITYKLRSMGKDGGPAEEIPEYAVDDALLAEMRAIEVQIATHLGTWKRRIEYSDSESSAKAATPVALTVTFVNANAIQSAGESDQRPVPAETPVSLPAPQV